MKKCPTRPKIYPTRLRIPTDEGDPQVASDSTLCGVLNFSPWGRMETKVGMDEGLGKGSGLTLDTVFDFSFFSFLRWKCYG